MTLEFDFHAFASSLGAAVAQAIAANQQQPPNLGARNPLPGALRPYGGKEHENLVAWIMQVTDAFEAQKVVLEDRLKHVSSALSDAALQWYVTIRQSVERGEAPQFHSWDDFTSRLKVAFEPPNFSYHVRLKLRNIRQTGSVASFVFEFRTLLGQINDMGEADKVLYFAEGLKDCIRAEIHARCPASLDEVINLATGFEHKRYPKANSTYNPAVSSSSSQVASSAMEICNVTKEHKHKKIGRCFNCNQQGHYAQDCVKPKKKSMKSIANIMDEANWFSESIASIKGSQLLIVRGTCEGIPIRALIDSGAAGNFIANHWIERNRSEIQSKLEPSESNIQVVTGEVCRSEGSLRGAKVKLNAHEETLSAKIISMKNYDVILGKPWLAKHNPYVDWREDRIDICKGNDCLTIRGEQHYVEVNTEIGLLEVLSNSLSKDDTLVLVNAVTEQESEVVDPAVEELKSKFKEIFEPLANLPPKRNHDHAIELIEGAEPIAASPYRMSPKELEALRSELDKLMEYGFIRKSKSPWSSPVLFVRKKDNSLRLCVDYRKLNKLTVKSRYPIPRVDELMDRLSGALFFSKIDLASGYHQVRVKSEDVEKTAFATRYGHFEYVVLPFGLCNAPATFMKVMNETFSEALDSFAIIYLDDIVIFSKTKEEHLKHLAWTFEKLKENSFKVKPSKCSFLMTEIEFLGFRMTPGGIAVDDSKVKAICQMGSPRDVSEVRSALGLTGFYRKFIPQYAEIAAPITALLKADTEFKWGVAQEMAWKTLKAKLTEAPILCLPDYSKPFIVTCDASGSAVGGVISQLINGSEKAIAFESRKLTAAESNYPVHELELLAIVHCLKVWRCFVEGSTVVVKTDHASLKFLKTQRHLSRRVARWCEYLETLDIEIEYIKGCTNSVADALSRLEINYVESSDWPSLYESYFSNGMIEEEDKHLLEKLRANEKQFALRNDVVYHLEEDGSETPYIPFIARVDLVQQLHCDYGHPGTEGTLNLLKSRGWWPGRAKNVKEWIAGCIVCQKTSGKKETHSQLMPFAMTLPFRRWGLDFIGRLPTTQNGNNWIITARDYGTRWCIAKAVKDATAKTVAEFIYEEIVVNYGAPDELLTDRGKNFLAEGVSEYLKLIGTSHLKTSSYHPRTNGLVENFNGTLGKMITKFIEAHEVNRSRWDKFLPQALFACRIQASRTTGSSPFQLTYGVSPKLPSDSSRPIIAFDSMKDEELENWRIMAAEKMRLDRQEARKRLEEGQKKAKERHDSNIKPLNLQVNDLVLLSNEGKLKFDSTWKGPFIVSQTHSKNTALVKLKSLDNKELEDWINIDRLKEVPKAKNVDGNGFIINSIDEVALFKVLGNVALAHKEDK